MGEETDDEKLDRFANLIGRVRTLEESDRLQRKAAKAQLEVSQALGAELSSSHRLADLRDQQIKVLNKWALESTEIIERLRRNQTITNRICLVEFALVVALFIKIVI